jgi:hypothetical protein
MLTVNGLLLSVARAACGEHAIIARALRLDRKGRLYPIVLAKAFEA